MEFNDYYVKQYTTLKEGLYATSGTIGLEPKTYYRGIIEKAAYACQILNLHKNDSVLEIGPGIGDVSKLLSKTVKYLHCCDISKSLLLMTEVNCQDCNNISFHCNFDHDEKPLYFLENNSIDKVLAYGVLEHCYTNTIIQYVKEVQRILKPNGLFHLRFNKIEKCELASRPVVDHDKILEFIKELNFKINEQNIFIASNKGPNRNIDIPVIILTLAKK